MPLVTVGRTISRALRIEPPVRRLYYRARDMSGSLRELTFRNPYYRLQGSPDGLPLPPSRLVYLVQGNYSLRGFYASGVRGAASISAVLAKNGLSMQDFRAVLDFGCGCGRIIRHWKDVKGPDIRGSDYNPRLVEFCRRALPFARFSLNQLRSPLEYPDGAFDFVYALSVFTHLDEGAEDFWIDELRRVLRPSGYLLFSVHGLHRLHALTKAQREKFERGERITVNQDQSGTNDCYTYHPEPFVRRKFGRVFAIVNFVPGGQQDSHQDVFLLQRPPSS